MDFQGISKNSAANYNEGLRAYLIGVFNKMFLATGITGAVAWLLGTNPTAMLYLAKGPMWLCFFALMGLGIYLPVRLHKISSSTAYNLFLVYSVLMGIWTAPLIGYYTGESVATAFLSAAVFFGVMSVVGYTTKKDLTNLGQFMFIGLITICVTSLLNVLFFKSSGLSIGLSALSIVVFCGLTAYDLQKIKVLYNYAPNDEILSKVSIIGALQLYLDFINIFISLLHLLGVKKD